MYFRNAILLPIHEWPYRLKNTIFKRVCYQFAVCYRTNAGKNMRVISLKMSKACLKKVILFISAILNLSRTGVFFWFGGFFLFVSLKNTPNNQPKRKNHTLDKGFPHIHLSICSVPRVWSDDVCEYAACTLQTQAVSDYLAWIT